MGLWKRASGALKDRTSLWQANLTRRTALRNPDIEKAVIRATRHRESAFDRRNADRVCEWVRLSDFNLKPVLWSVSNRMEKTQNWVIALKALYLMHAVMNSRAPCVKKIGRLPFDLSNFEDGHLPPSKAWPYNALIRAYYAFLDQKSTAVFQHAEDEREGFVMMNEVVLLQKLQNLVDLLMQIKPASRAVFVPLVRNVMDVIIIDIYDIYSRICRGIAIVIVNIYSAGKAEATMALNLVQKATQQGEDLINYFEFCHEIGVVNASEFPVFDRVPEEGIQELEQIIKRFDSDKLMIMDIEEKDHEEKAIVAVEKKKKKNDSGLKTVITDNWERFDEDFATKSIIQEPPDLIDLS
ncbi:hypothetical protein ACS0TY_011342 [Phlomoides rotata]